MQRETMGKIIGEHQAIQLKLADMATRLEAARLLTRNAAERRAQGLRCDVEAGMAKLFASETALELSTEAMRIHGGVGYTTEFPVERYYRDAPLMIIGEGTNEIQRIVIARGLLARARGSGLSSSLVAPAPAACAELGQHLVGVLAEAAAPARPVDGQVREAHRAVDGAPRSSRRPRRAARGTRRWRRAAGPRARPPAPGPAPTRRPRASKRSAHSSRVRSPTIVVEDGDHLGAVLAQRPGVGEAGVVAQVRPAEGAVAPCRCGGPPRGR